HCRGGAPNGSLQCVRISVKLKDREWKLTNADFVLMALRDWKYGSLFDYDGAFRRPLLGPPSWEQLCWMDSDGTSRPLTELLPIWVRYKYKTHLAPEWAKRRAAAVGWELAAVGWELVRYVE